MQFKERPYNLLLLSAIILLIISFIVKRNTLDIHLHDTYFVITVTYIIRFLATVSAIFWGIYMFTFKLLFSNRLTWTHIIITILTIAGLGITSLMGDKLATLALKSFGQYSQYTRISVFVLGLLLLGQLTYLLNLLLGILKRQT
jgi:hypothetical protein